MEKKYIDIFSLIDDNLSTNEFENDQKAINKFRHIKEQKYFTRSDLIEMCEWKTQRTKNLIPPNSESEVRSISRRVFISTQEADKMKLLTQLKGVAVPTGSAILMLTDPKNYGVIDVRVWQVLYLYEEVEKKPNGRGLGIKDWDQYLKFLRDYAEKFSVKARDIERTLYLHHEDIQDTPLYKYT
jgi:hypothetical protein